MTAATGGERVTAVMVTYRSKAVVGDALHALEPAVRAGWLRVVVVDNASGDGTAEAVERAHPWAQLLRSERNLGYGRACNLGFREVRSPYVVFMNPDVILRPEALEGLVRHLEAHPKAGAVAPATRLPGGAWQHWGGLTTPWTILSQALGRGVRGHRILQGGGASFRTDWICGAIMLLPSALFRELDGFDPRFFLYFEETDLCRRIGRAGYELWALGEAEAAHRGSESARQVDPTLRQGDCLSEHFFRSRFYYLCKHHGRGIAVLAEALELAAKGVHDVWRLLGSRGGGGAWRRRMQAPLFTPPSRPPG